MSMLSPATQALFGAIAANDLDGVHEALDDGANPLALGQCEGLAGGVPALHLACMLAEDLDVRIVRVLLTAGAPTASAGPASVIQGDALNVLLHRLPPPRVVPFLQAFADHGLKTSPAHFILLLLHAGAVPGKIAALDVLWEMLPHEERASKAMASLLARWLAVSAHRQRGHRPDPLLVTWLIEHGSRLEACATPTTPAARDFLERSFPEALSQWEHLQTAQAQFATSGDAKIIAPWLRQALQQGRRRAP